MAQDDSPLPITSSSEPVWESEARDCYREVMLVLQRARIPFAVGGAFAVHKHTGIWRTTKDLDLLMPPEAVTRALAELRSADFESYVEDPIWLAKARCGKHFVDLITGIGNASLFVDESWIERSSTANILGVPCKVLAAEEMLASKVFVAFRERFDGADVAHLIRACGRRLDWERVLQLLGSHWELLFWSLSLYAYIYPAQTDVVPEHIWTALTKRFAEQVRHPNKDAPFRGTLVDPNMFAIDVKEWGQRDLYQENRECHSGILAANAPAEGKE
jgi:hypothetical protein